MYGWWRPRLRKQPILTFCLVLGAALFLLRLQIVLALEPGRTVGWRVAPIRIQGVVQAVHGEWWQVAGRRIHVSSALAPRVAVGTQVLVGAVTAPDASLDAVQVLPTTTADIKQELTDVVMALPQEGVVGRWQIGPAIVWIDAQTVLTPTGCHPQIGELVSVVIEQGEAKHALSLACAADQVDGLAEFTGRVELLPQRDDLLGTWQVDGVGFIVETTTKREAALSLGDMVDVSVVKHDGTWRALAVTGSSQALETLRLTGQISDLTADAFTLQEVALKGAVRFSHIVVDERTFFDESRGAAVEGVWAEVRVVPQADGTLWAKYVKIGRME